FRVRQDAVTNWVPWFGLPGRWRSPLFRFERVGTVLAGHLTLALHLLTPQAQALGEVPQHDAALAVVHEVENGLVLFGRVEGAAQLQRLLRGEVRVDWTAEPLPQEREERPSGPGQGADVVGEGIVAKRGLLPAAEGLVEVVALGVMVQDLAAAVHPAFLGSQA